MLTNSTLFATTQENTMLTNSTLFATTQKNTKRSNSTQLRLLTALALFT